VASSQVIEDRVVTGFAAVMGNVDDAATLLCRRVRQDARRARRRLRYLWNATTRRTDGRLPTSSRFCRGQQARLAGGAAGEVPGRIRRAQGESRVPRDAARREALIGIRKVRSRKCHSRMTPSRPARRERRCAGARAAGACSKRCACGVLGCQLGHEPGDDEPEGDAARPAGRTRPARQKALAEGWSAVASEVHRNR